MPKTATPNASPDDIVTLKQQIEDLNRTQNQYKQLVDASPEAIAIHAQGTLFVC